MVQFSTPEAGRARCGNGFQGSRVDKTHEMSHQETATDDEVLLELRTPGTRESVLFVKEMSFRASARRARALPSSGASKQQQQQHRQTRQYHHHDYDLGHGHGHGHDHDHHQQQQLFNHKNGAARYPPPPPAFDEAMFINQVPQQRSQQQQQHHHRRTSSPMDGACFAVLGVLTGLQTPGADHWTVARALVESSVDLRTRNAKGMTPLHLACGAGQVDVARVLLMAGADSQARDHRSRRPLHMAALTENADLVRTLLARGADPNQSSDMGTTALHNAALIGRIAVARILLAAGATPDAKDHNSFSPLYLAAQNGHTQVVLDLLGAGADPSLKTNRGFTPLHVAARCGRLSVLRALLDAGVPADCPSSPAETMPLHLAAGFSRYTCVEELLRRGANPRNVNKRGRRPLDLVGTLLPPTAKNSGLRPTTWTAIDSNTVQIERTRAMLAQAESWERRRGAVMLCAILRSRRGERESLGPSKRSKLSMNRVAAEHGPPGEGWVVERVCAQADSSLMMKDQIGMKRWRLNSPPEGDRWFTYR